MSFTSMHFIFLIGGAIIVHGAVAGMAADKVANAADPAGKDGTIIVTGERGEASVLRLLGRASRRMHSA